MRESSGSRGDAALQGGNEVTKTRREVLRGLAAAGVGLGALGAPSILRAQEFPSQPVRLIVGLPPGGTTDTLARLFAPYFSKLVGQPVLVENKSGGNGALAAQTVATADDNGHTIYFSNVSQLCAPPHVYPDLPVNPVTGLDHITMIAESNLILISNAELKEKTLAEIVEMSKAKPDTMVSASTGPVSTNNITFQMLALQTGAKMKVVTYRGTGPILTDLLANQVQVHVGGVAPAEPYITSDRLGGLVVMAKERLPYLPDVPSSGELGLEGLEQMTTWSGLHVAKGTPDEVKARIHELAVTALAEPELTEKLVSQRNPPIGDSQDAFTRRVNADYELYGRLIQEAGIIVE